MIQIYSNEIEICFNEILFSIYRDNVGECIGYLWVERIREFMTDFLLNSSMSKLSVSSSSNSSSEDVSL